MAYITPDDLAAFATLDAAKAAAMVADASAMAVMAAPCLSDEAALTEAQRAAVKSVLRRAILRWDEAGAGSRKSVTETAGIYGHGETLEVSSSKGLFWPSEIADLQAICRQLSAPGASARVGGVDMLRGAWPAWYDPTDIQRPEGFPVNPEVLTVVPSVSSPMET